MESTLKICENCKKLELLLVEKEREIEKLNLHVQKLTALLSSYQNDDVIVQNDCCESTLKIESNDKCFVPSASMKTEKRAEACLDNIENSCDSTLENKEKNSVSHEGSEHENNFGDYVYDENVKMYYSISTGFYYDQSSGLFYVPQNGAYYKYNYSENKYELYEHNEKDQDSSKTDMCSSVVDKVNKLNLNDNDGSFNEQDHFALDQKAQNPDKVEIELTKSETSCDSTNDWLLPEGSHATIQDLVKEVAEQSSGMTDYIYDENSKMYYCKSTGYFYDPIKKLLYDPNSQIYYRYIQETSSYEFYCSADPYQSKKSVQNHLKSKIYRSRRKAKLKKKLVTNLSDDEKDISTEKDLAIESEEYSSLEEGEIFSSDSETERVPETETLLTEESSCSSSTNYPCVRAIVQNSSKLKIGSLILITCIGGVVGRETTSAIYIPDVSISKAHAEIQFDEETWKYSVKDLGSQNGTFVNDIRLSEPKQKSEYQILRHGDMLTFGMCKLLIHVHFGHETCEKCEPGQVIAELNTQKEEPASYNLKTKEEREKERRQEMNRIKKKYGLKGREFIEKKNHASPTNTNYEDKAEIRRQTVGSQNPYEKTETASMECAMSTSNKGYQMLKKLGWNEGDTLGPKTGPGLTEPIPLRPWVGKAGFGSSTSKDLNFAVPEDPRKKRWVKAQERYFKLST